MPVTTNISLQGKINLVGSNSYNLIIPSQTETPFTNKLSSKAFEEVFIICDTTNGGIDIFLPKISDFENFWNTKIYIIKNTNDVNAIVVYPYNNEVVINTINGFPSKNYALYKDAAYYQIVNDNTWMALYCPSGLA